MNSYTSAIVMSVSSPIAGGGEEVRIMRRITALYQSKQMSAWVAVLSARVGGQTGGNNVLFTWV